MVWLLLEFVMFKFISQVGVGIILIWDISASVMWRLWGFFLCYSLAQQPSTTLLHARSSDCHLLVLMFTNNPDWFLFHFQHLKRAGGSSSAPISCPDTGQHDFPDGIPSAGKHLSGCWRWEHSPTELVPVWFSRQWAAQELVGQSEKPTTDCEHLLFKGYIWSATFWWFHVQIERNWFIRHRESHAAQSKLQWTNCCTKLPTTSRKCAHSSLPQEPSMIGYSAVMR